MGEVAVYPVGLCAAAQKVAPRYPVGGSFKGDTAEEEVAGGHLVLLLGDNAPVHVEHRASRTVSDHVSADRGLSVCVHRRRQHLHVRVRCHQVVLPLPFRCDALYVVHLRRHLDHTL